MKFLAKLEAMSETDVLDLVPPRIMASIKRDDKRPIFKAFVIGQEGEAKPRIVGIGPMVQRWFSSAIQAMMDKMRIGTEVFNLHAATNAKEGRTAIGEVVGKALRKVGDRLSAIAVTYLYPPYQDLKLDVASVEANIMVPESPSEQDVEDLDVLDVTGIALGNSDVNRPAFPGATLLAQLQAFADKGHTPGGNGSMTKEEIIAGVKDLRLNPSDVFQPTQIIGDPIVVEHVKEKTVGEYAHRMRTDEAFQKAKADWEKEKGDLTKKYEAAQSTAMKVASGETFKAILKERKLVDEVGKPKDERLIKFLTKSYEKSFKGADEASLKKDLDKFVDTGVDEFKDLFGEPKQGAEGGNAGGGVPASGGSGDGADLTDPKNNPFIPQAEGAKN